MGWSAISNRASDPNRVTAYAGPQGAGLCRQKRTEEQNAVPFQSYDPRQALERNDLH